MPQVKVTREEKIDGDRFFHVYINNQFKRAFYFTPNTEEMEKTNAIEYAQRLERGETDIVETIYETESPKPTNDETKTN